LYALKTIDKEKISQEASLEVLRREITIHMNMVHSNIIRLYDYIEDEGKVHLILEFA
jgi:serine/threonine protein kinase